MVRGIVLLNIKGMIKDKLTFLWSIILPSIILVINKDSVTSMDQISFWWSYIIINALIFGIGVYAVQQRETGCLRFVFSIEKSPVKYFIANLFTQILFIFICLFFFNFICVILFRYNYLLLWIKSLWMLIICLPVAFIGYNLTLIPNVHGNNLQSIASIVMFVLFIALMSTREFNRYNPLMWINSVHYYSASYDAKAWILFLVIYIVCIGISIPSIVRYHCLSHETR